MQATNEEILDWFSIWYKKYEIWDAIFIQKESLLNIKILHKLLKWNANQTKLNPTQIGFSSVLKTEEMSEMNSDLNISERDLFKIRLWIKHRQRWQKSNGNYCQLLENNSTFEQEIEEDMKTNGNPWRRSFLLSFLCYKNIIFVFEKICVLDNLSMHWILKMFIGQL